MLPEGLDDLYQDIILDHYKRPRNQGTLENAALKSEGYNPFCGDQVIFTAALDSEGQVAEVGIEGQGCAISQASASMMSECLKGLKLSEISALSLVFRNMMHDEQISPEEEEFLSELAVLQGVKKFPVRIKCALLAWSTLDDAIAEHVKALPPN
tara:strand:+ start:296 stop:757 length:462 start_codon:yes stop_codon:yes gene_type:complete